MRGYACGAASRISTNFKGDEPIKKAMDLLVEDLLAYGALPLESGGQGMSEPVFTPEQVSYLWRHQFGPWRSFGSKDESLPLRMHPFTCGNRSDHPVVAGDKGVLVPTVRGWICPFCDYTQDWAHGFMKGATP